LARAALDPRGRTRLLALWAAEHAPPARGRRSARGSSGTAGPGAELRARWLPRAARDALIPSEHPGRAGNHAGSDRREWRLSARSRRMRGDLPDDAPDPCARSGPPGTSFGCRHALAFGDHADLRTADRGRVQWDRREAAPAGHAQ